MTLTLIIYKNYLMNMDSQSCVPLPYIVEYFDWDFVTKSARKGTMLMDTRDRCLLNIVTNLSSGIYNTNSKCFVGFR